MGLFRGSFFFLLGMSCGIYIDQNYDMPKIKQLADTWLFKAKRSKKPTGSLRTKSDDIILSVKHQDKGFSLPPFVRFFGC
ncbi:unnamed protein product [Spirodela intermedia]|uniref:Uncharacterized protein n=1 Tax=Spirodela intermedia TaxID=51605 RepID=A0A7I8IAT9_SPIIN|nr:unnamed protein product [Spirodela intermedia]CAA6654846.1 unnamed protein product [Spirodela intermedia]